MMTNANVYHEEQTGEQNYNDSNASYKSLLLVTDADDENRPLLNGVDTTTAIRESIISSLSPLSTVHCHVPDDKFDYGARNRLFIVLVICIIFMTIEVLGGILSNSTAVVTDAAHMGIDVASFLISLTAMYLARKRPTRKLSYGYIRAEVLGALLSVLTIWLVTGILVYIAVQRCINRKFQVKPIEMTIVASCGVVFNIVMLCILHVNVCGKSVSHHGHSHNENYPTSLTVDTVSIQNQESVLKPKKSTKNINVRAAMIHVLGDLVQSIGVLCAALLIKFKPEYKLADPICTFIFSVLVIITTITIMRDIVFVLMEAVPSNINYLRVVNDLLQLPGVRNAHSLHIWSLSMQRTALSVHIAIDANLNYLTMLKQVQDMLRCKHAIARTTIQIELYDEQIINSCEDCRQPAS